MKYNTRDVYFGCGTYNVSKNNFWKTSTEVFLKNGDKYLMLKSRTKQVLNEYKPGTDEYLTVSELYPLVNMMSDKKQIPETISGTLINLYLTKHKFEKSKQINHTQDTSKKY